MCVQTLSVSGWVRIATLLKLYQFHESAQIFFFLAMLFHANEYLPFTDIPHPLGLPVHSNGIHSNEE